MGEGIIIFVLWYLGIAYNYYVGDLGSESCESRSQNAESGKAQDKIKNSGQDKKSQDEQDSDQLNPLVKIEVNVPPMDQFSVALEAETAEPPAEPAPEPESDPEPASDDE